MGMEYTVILMPESEGGFTVTMPAFPDYVGFAEDEEEALALAREGIALELERLQEEGEDPPVEAGPPTVLRVGT